MTTARPLQTGYTKNPFPRRQGKGSKWQEENCRALIHPFQQHRAAKRCPQADRFELPVLRAVVPRLCRCHIGKTQYHRTVEVGTFQSLVRTIGNQNFAAERGESGHTQWQLAVISGLISHFIADKNNVSRHKFPRICGSRILPQSGTTAGPDAGTPKTFPHSRRAVTERG